jgi:hypothetical protein
MYMACSPKKSLCLHTDNDLLYVMSRWRDASPQCSIPGSVGETGFSYLAIDMIL